jgi:2,5-furandicarboxylate decarboxylase 1
LKDLRSFLDDLRREHPNELVEVEREVDPKFEMSGLVMRLEKQGLFPAFYFKNVKGSKFPVVSNMHASFRRMAIALETTEAELGATYRKRESNPLDPVEVRSGPVKEVVIPEAKVDLTKDIPNIVYHEKDGGPYIALGCMVMKDPELGHRNLGVYRIMIQGKRQLGAYFAQTNQGFAILKKYEAAKKPMEVALVIGHHPTFCIGSVANTSPGVDQYSVIGGVMGEPVSLTKCQSVDIEVPSNAEMVIEGVIPPGVTEMEGPFGEFTGGYGPRTPRPIIQVKAITMRKEPIFQDAFSGHPDNLVLGYFGRLNAIYRTVNSSVRTVKDIHLPISGRCRFICYVAIKKIREGEPKNACFGALAADAFLKYVVVVDEDVDLKKDDEIMHAIAMWVRPDKDIFIVSNALGSPLDPTAEQGYIVAKVGIDATKKPGMPEMLSVPNYQSMKVEDYIPAAKLKSLKPL